MRRLASILLLLAFAGSGSGGAAALHRLQHAGEDEQHAGEQHAGHAGAGHAGACHADADHEAVPRVDGGGDDHPAGECRLCADLRAPATADSWDPNVLPAGTARSHVRPLVPQRDHVAVHVRFETTGPPAA